MDDLSYIENLSNAELIDIIENIWGFEETTKALFHLIKRDPQKSVELGKDILRNNKGDDYLQATVPAMISGIDTIDVVGSLSTREEDFDKILLYDILQDISSGFYIKDSRKLPDEFVNKIIHSYDALDKDSIRDEDMRRELIENFNEFIGKIKD